MRNNKLMIGLLVVVLLLGTGAGIWFAMQPDNPGHGVMAGGNVDDGRDPSLEDGDPLTGPGSALANTGAKHTDTPEDTTDKGNGTGAVSKVGNGEPQPVNKTPQPDVKTEWEATTIEASVRGRVTFKSDDRPVVGATVKLEVYDWRTSVWNWNNTAPDEAVPSESDKPKDEVSGSATTDGAGEYSLKVSFKTWHMKGTEPGDDGFDAQFIVVATSPGYAPAKSQQIAVDSAKEAVVNLKLAIPAAVTGRVVDSLTHEGIANARGQLTSMDMADNGRPSVPATFVTDDKGYFSLNALPAGAYGLNVWATGYAAYNGWQEQGRLNLSGGGETDLGEILMTPAASATGRVISAETSKPIAGASVELRQVQQWGNSNASSATTAKDGTFRLTDIAPGSFTLRVRCQDYAIFLQEGVTIDAGKPADLGDIKLERGLTLTGVVLDTQGKPLQGVRVTVSEPRSGSFDFGQQDRTVSQADSDAEGKFTLSGISEGKWALGAKLDGFAPYLESIEIAGAGKPLEIHLSHGGSIIGRLLDAGGNPIVSNATIGATSQDAGSYNLFKAAPSTMLGLLYQDAGAVSAPGEDGTFSLKHIPAGTYVVFCMGDQTASVWKDNVEVKEDGVTDIGDLRPSSPGRLQVTVTEAGAPVPGVEVRVTAMMGMAGGDDLKGVTDNMGVVMLVDVPEGTWLIRTSRDQSEFDTQIATRRVTVKSGTTTEFQLELRPKEGVYLHGRVTMNGKASITDIILMGLGDLSDAMISIKPVEGGYYEYAGLKTGHYIMHVREGDKYVTAKVSLDLLEEGDREFTRDFRGFKVSGKVTTPEDSPAQRSSVSVTIGHATQERPNFSVWLRGSTGCGTDGTFQFNSVTAGDYVVTATLDGVGSARLPLTIGSADTGGVNLAITANGGTIKLTLTKLNGTPVSGGGFGSVTLLDASGASVDLGEGFQGFLMIGVNNSQVLPNVPPGTYTISISGSGYLPKQVSGITAEKGKTTNVEVELTAAAELHLTVSNTEVTQAMLNGASVHYYNSQGQEVPRESNPMDAMTNEAPPEAATLVCKYIGPAVSEVRIKLAGYTEITVSVVFEAGKKIETQESLVAE